MTWMTDAPTGAPGAWYCTRCRIVHVQAPKGQCPNDTEGIGDGNH
jgi:hypothetical protein